MLPGLRTPGAAERPSAPAPLHRAAAKTVTAARDLACVLFFLVHAAFFGYLAAEGVGGGRLGQLQKLYLPRDFRGTFCGIDAGQADMTSYPTLALAINAREIYDKLALEALCSQPVVGMLSAEEAASCTGSSGATDTLANLQQSVADPSKALELLGGSLLSPGAVLAAASTYLTPVCTTSCNLTANRTFSYSPPPSVPWASAWQRLSTHLPRIELSAWSSTDCPYEGRYCVPFPGISLAPGPDFLCLPQLDPALAQQLSQAVSQELASLASANATAFLLADVNDAAGAVFTSLDVLGVVLFISLVYGVVYMALVRFCAKPLVWLSILVLFLVFLCAGSLAIVRSMQCAQGGLLGATEQTMAALQNITGADFTGASPGCEESWGAMWCTARSCGRLFESQATSCWAWAFCGSSSLCASATESGWPSRSMRWLPSSWRTTPMRDLGALSAARASSGPLLWLGRACGLHPVPGAGWPCSQPGLYRSRCGWQRHRPRRLQRSLAARLRLRRCGQLSAGQCHRAGAAGPRF
ncbi:unnamed protein product [Effrenium voratum]|uniref:Uncharacterized protein n=1 Tax=Effrenium voratum TaxID=2562239 RepID=A0AA36JH21_9DINO|nr:unnamed protein product [Effrenium voratum]